MADPTAGFIDDVPVFVTSVRVASGKRVGEKIAVDVDGAVYEELGANPTRYTLQVLLIQDGEHITQDPEGARQELVFALLSPGPHTIQAPSIGLRGNLWLTSDIDVALFDVTQQGVARATLTFSDGDPIPELTADPGGAARAKVAELFGSANELFVQGYPSPPKQGILDTFLAAADHLTEVRSLIDQQIAPVNAVSGQVSSFANDLVALVNAPAQLADRFYKLAAEVYALIGGIISDAPRGRQGDVLLQALALAPSFNDDVRDASQGITDPDNASPLEQDEAEQIQYAQDYVTSILTPSAVTPATQIDYSTSDQALGIAAAFEPAFLALTSQDDVDGTIFNDLLVLRARERAFIGETAADLPTLLSYVVPHDVSLFGLVALIYQGKATGWGDVEQAADLLTAQNNLHDPRRVLAGTNIVYPSELNL